MDVRSIKPWWPFHPFETTVDQVIREYAAIMHSSHQVEREQLLVAFLDHHISVLGDAPDFYMTSDHMAHTLDDMLKGQVPCVEIKGIVYSKPIV